MAPPASGAPSVAADAEICAMLSDTLEAVGIPRGDYLVRVNNRKVLNGVMEVAGVLDPSDPDRFADERGIVLRAIDKLDRLGPAGVRALLGAGREDQSGDFTKGAGLADEQADVVMENFSPGTMERLGMGYEAMRERNPALIYASISGFGQTGPNRDRPGVDIIMQGYSGLMSITGHPDRGPAKTGVSLGDIGAGVWTAIGVLAALVERDRSGEGQYIDTALLDTSLALMENPIVRYLGAGEIPARMGSRNPLTSPYQAYPCKDGWVVIGVVRDWDHFCVVIDREDLRTDERFNTREGRRTNQAELEPLLSETTKKYTYAEWVEKLELT